MTTPDSRYAPFAGRWVGHVQAFAAAFPLQYGEDPESGSIADQELNQNTESGPGGPWPRHEKSLPYDIAGGLITLAITNQLASLERLLVPDMALFGFQSITRSIMEACARAAWLLDPGIDVRQRVVRSFILEWESIKEGKLVESAGGGDGSRFNRQILDLKTRLALLGIDEKLDKNGVFIGVDGQSIPGKLDSVKRFLPVLGVDKGEMWYRSISGVTHSVLYGVTEYLQRGEVTSTGRTRAAPDLPLHVVANAAVLSVDGFLLVVQRHADLWGRDVQAVMAKRLEVKGQLLSALNRPELRTDPPALGI